MGLHGFTYHPTEVTLPSHLQLKLIYELLNPLHSVSAELLWECRLCQKAGKKLYDSSESLVTNCLTYMLLTIKLLHAEVNAVVGMLQSYPNQMTKRWKKDNVVTQIRPNSRIYEHRSIKIQHELSWLQVAVASFHLHWLIRFFFDAQRNYIASSRIRVGWTERFRSPLNNSNRHEIGHMCQ